MYALRAEFVSFREARRSKGRRCAGTRGRSSHGGAGAGGVAAPCARFRRPGRLPTKRGVVVAHRWNPVCDHNTVAPAASAGAHWYVRGLAHVPVRRV